MNDSINNPNDYGCNPFDDCDEESLPQIYKLRYYDKDNNYKEYSSFNGFIKEKSEIINGGVKINKIIDNIFFKSPDFDYVDANGIIHLITESQYLVCLNIGFFGLQPVFETTGDGTRYFDRFDMYDIGTMIPNILDANEYIFTNCDFCTVDEQITLVVVFRSKKDGQYRYVYMNDSSYDDIYGFQEIKNLVTDGMILNPSQVFTEVDSIKQLGDVSIAMTDYGFWDIETNTTDDIVYSYNGRKSYSTLDNHEWIVE